MWLIGQFSTETADPDFWWHLRTGQYIWQTRTLPAPDPFSYTSDLGQPAYPGELRVRRFNLTHEWLAQVIWYGVYSAAGFPGVVLFKGFLLAGFCALVGLVAYGRSGDFYWSAAAAAAATPIAALFASDRPALVTFLLVGVFVLILERGRPLWLLPALSVVWANSHGGFFLGWLIVGAYAVADRKSRRLWILTLATVAASGLNPNSWRIFEILLSYRQSSLTQTLVEWSSPPLWGAPYAFPILLYASAAVLAFAWRRVRTTDWVLFLLFSVASLMAFRNIMLTAFLAPILIVSYFPWRRPLPAVALLGVLVATGLARGRFFELRAALWAFPTGAADFLETQKLRAPLFNTYELGGYLIWRLWPHYRVFIDGRALNESVYKDYLDILGSSGSNPQESRRARRGMLDRYGVGLIVANAFEHTSGVLYPMVLELASEAETQWQLVYEDPQAVIFVRDPASTLPILPKSRVMTHLEANCGLRIENDPEMTLCARTLGQLFASRGDRPRALRWFGVYLARPHAPDPEAEGAYRRLLR